MIQLCENLFVHELVGILLWLSWTCGNFLCMFMEKFGSCVQTFEKILIVVKFWWGIDFLLWWWDIGCKDIFWV